MATQKVNKSAFVRSLGPAMPAGDVVKAASAKGIKLSEKFVHTIRYNAKKAAAKRSGGAPAARGPGRPRKVTNGNVGNGIAHEIERIVEAKVNALLKARLGALLGG